MKNLLTFILMTISIAALGQTVTDTTIEKKILGTWEICQVKTDNDLFSQIINDSLKIDKLTFLKDVGCESLKLGRGYYYFKPDSVFEYGYSPYEEPTNDGMLNGVYVKLNSPIKSKWIYDKASHVLIIKLNDRNDIQLKVISVTENELVLKLN